jgi:hypothetical protein
MPDSLFQGLFDTDMTSVLGVTDFLLCIGISLAIGWMLAVMYMYRTRCTKSFAVTLALLPAVVCVVIMMVNGNVGTGVAVAGAFSLVRFRSAAGSAKEISMLFTAMGAGLIAGMGYLAFAVLFSVILGGMSMLYARLDFGSDRKANLYKTLRITIPEDLDYTGIFDDLFKTYTTAWELSSVKTTNMGSMFKLTYRLQLSDEANEKELIDKLRCRNGNLEIAVSNQDTAVSDL